MTENAPLHRLLFLIDSKTEELQKYVLRPDAKDSYIEKQNHFIAELTSIYNHLECFSDFDLWLHIANETKNILQKDAELSGVIITLPFKESGENFGKLDFNIYAND
jgi:hypothetical protein